MCCRMVINSSVRNIGQNHHQLMGNRLEQRGENLRANLSPLAVGRTQRTDHLNRGMRLYRPRNTFQAQPPMCGWCCTIPHTCPAHTTSGNHLLTFERACARARARNMLIAVGHVSEILCFLLAQSKPTHRPFAGAAAARRPARNRQPTIAYHYTHVCVCVASPGNAAYK